MKPKLVNSTSEYQGRPFEVKTITIEFPDQKSRTYDIVLPKDSVVILPMDNDKKVWFVRQYRPAAGDYLLELPAGMLEKNESPDDTAMRELREEIGMRAGSLRRS